jgi:uncharacterized protein YbcI
MAEAIGAVYEAATGQGPSAIRVLESADPSLVFTLEGTATTYERTLIRVGEQQLVQRERRALREAMTPPLKAAVERSLGVLVATVSGEHDPATGTETLRFRLAAGGPMH